MSKIFLTADQIKNIYEVAGNRSLRDEVLFRIMGNTGFRISDARTLLIEDVSDKSNTVYNSIRKRMQKTGAYIERSINDITRERIAKYLPMVLGKSIYLFPGSDRSKPIGRTYCHELFKYILKHVMPEGTDFSAASTHTLRRSVAMLLAEDTSIQVASVFLGHSSVSSTTAYLSKDILGKECDEYLKGKLNF